MSWALRLEVWRLRWALRLWRGISDEQIVTGIENLSWRFASTGRDPTETLAILLDRIAALLGADAIRRVLLDASGQRVPDGWWDQ